MYTMRYRKPGQWFYRTLKLLGHQFQPEADKIIFSLSDGSVYEMPNASKLEIRVSKSTVATLNKKKEGQNGDLPGTQGQDHK
jgi:hypothetical protein